MKLHLPHFLVLGNTMCDDGDDARMSLPPTMAIAKSNLVLKSFGKAAKFHFLTLVHMCKHTHPEFYSGENKLASP